MISQKNRRFTQYLSILLTLLLLVTTVPTAVAADTNDDTVVKTTRVAEEVTAIQPNDKIAEDLRSDMQTGEEVEVIRPLKSPNARASKTARMYSSPAAPSLKTLSALCRQPRAKTTRCS